MSSLRSVDSLHAGGASALYHDPAPVGVVAVALLLGTYGLFGLPVDVPLLVAGFSGVTLVYAADRVWTPSPEDRINRPERVAWIRAHRHWLTIETVGVFALGGAMLPYLEWTTLLFVGGFGVVAGLHVWPRSSDRPVLHGLAKPAGIAGAWAAGGALLPFVEARASMGMGAVLFFGYRALFILPNPMIADWGDRQGDADVGLATWASRWTLWGMRGVATGGLALAALGAVGWTILGATPLLVGIDAFGLLLMGGVVWGVEPTLPRDAFLADLVVAWPLVPALTAWMIV